MKLDYFRILEFEDHLSKYVKILNVAWLQKYFYVEENDELTLSNPQKYIINKGGFVFFAKLNDEIVGTVSLLKINDHAFELAKMAVDESVQGLGIGKKLIEHCFIFCQSNHIQQLVLYSNTKLESAIHLYKKYGFVEVPLDCNSYKRCNIKMVKNLSTHI